MQLLKRGDLFLNLCKVSDHVNQAANLYPYAKDFTGDSDYRILPYPYVKVCASAHPLPLRFFSTGVWSCFCFHESFIVIINKI